MRKHGTCIFILQDTAEARHDSLGLDSCLTVQESVSVGTEVVSPSQSAFGRMNEDEGDAGEGEAPPENEQGDLEDSDLEGDWDTVRFFDVFEHL